jgi:hypothetical protein
MPIHSKKIEKYCKYHKQICLWTPKGTTCIKRREEQRNKHESVIPDLYTCKGCKKTLPSSEYHKQRCKRGIKSHCKACIKKRDYARYNKWPGYIRKKVVASWSSHRNKEKLNRLTIKEATEMLEQQQYKCLHCKTSLQCTFGTQKKRNCKGASLDRINTTIKGYGNGNSQWLCMSCNNGKNTMSNREHKEKFHKRDTEIRRLKLKVNQLLKKINELRLEININKDAVQRLDGGGSNPELIFID